MIIRYFYYHFIYLHENVSLVTIQRVVGILFPS